VPRGTTDIRLSFAKPSETYDTYSALLHVVGAPTPQPPSALPVSGALKVQDEGTQYEITNNDQIIDISKSSGQITRWSIGTQSPLLSGPVLNLGQNHGGIDQFGQSTKDFVNSTNLITLPNPSIHIVPQASYTNVLETFSLTNASGAPVGAENVAYAISADSQIVVSWSIDWSGPDTHAFECGMGFTVSPILHTMSWYKNSPLPDYPQDSIGAPSGSIDIYNAYAHGSKRGLQWLAVSDSAKHGLALLRNGPPLIGRVDPSYYSPMIFASSGEAVDCELSSPWVADQDIVLSKDKPISGSFILRAF
jgi:hypothetical protein